MGIYDRDYIRTDPPRGARAAAGGLRMLSVNTWIIVACVAIFVVDGMTPRRWVTMGIEWNPDLAGQVDDSVVQRGEPRVTDAFRTGGRVIPLRAVRDLAVPTDAGPIVVGREHLQSMKTLESFLHFSTSRGFLRVEFWRLIGFQFLHANLWHLVFNMVGLYFFGPLVERYLGSKRYLAFYLLCGICGALMYVLLNVGGLLATMMLGSDVHIPGLLFNDSTTPLIGASAGVFGVLMAGAFLVPNAMVLVFFILPMRLSTLAYVLVGVALFSVITGGQNAGGEAGHLGGALAGFYFIRHPGHLHGFFDFLGRADPTSHHYRGARAGGRAAGRAMARLHGGGATRAEVDRILDKISAEGLHSLTDKEKRILRESSERGS